MRINHNPYASSCVRCQWKFIGEGDLCRECVENPLLDRAEDGIISSSKPEDIFQFMGWEFRVHTANDALKNEPWTILTCYKRLFNPENPGAVISVSSFSGDTKNSYSMKRSAAWLIAHWWEHYLKICPCLKGERDDEEDSNFRRTVIDSLLEYEARI